MRVYASLGLLLQLALRIYWGATGEGLLESGGGIIGHDFLAFYSAGMEIDANTTFSTLYDIKTQHARQLTVAPIGDFVHPFVSPACVALAFVPFASLPYAWYGAAQCCFLPLPFFPPSFLPE